MSGTLRVGVVPDFEALAAPLRARRDLVRAVADAGLDHLGLVDHISFRGGRGYDGLVQAASALSLHDELAVYLGVYLLPLRHPVPVARQLASLAELAPGRLVLGVGIGGEDRAEVSNCGVDPATRGRRMDECLRVVRALADGLPVTFHGAHVDVDQALVLPAPEPRIPFIVGGRSQAAERRVARWGDGWLALWVSPERFAATVARVADLAQTAGRVDPPTQHGLSVWCGFGNDPLAGRRHLAAAMETTYGRAFDDFARWSPCGTPAQVAEQLTPYIAAGCITFNLIARAASLGEALAGAAEVRRLLT